jgi:antitoxin (DNA-binding transcriptional repressor) of toxin-antitoxin stability system
MTRMGIKEFRERLSEVARGTEPVQVTHHGKVVGTFTPRRPFDPARAAEAITSVRRFQDELRAEGRDPEAMLRELGLDPWGVPLAQSDDR